MVRIVLVKPDQFIYNLLVSLALLSELGKLLSGLLCNLDSRDLAHKNLGVYMVFLGINK